LATATLIPIATQTLGSAAASITFSSIPGTYTDLRLVLNVAGYNQTASSNPVMQFNSDTATNYSYTNLAGSGSAAATGAATTTYIPIAAFSVGTAAQAYSYFIDIFSYAGSTNKTVLSQAAYDSNGAGYVELIVGLWRSTSAITSITVKVLSSTTFSTGTIATLFGI